MNRFGTPSLITRNTNDIQQVQLFLQMGLTLMVIAPIMCAGGVIMALREGAELSLLLGRPPWRRACRWLGCGDDGAGLLADERPGLVEAANRCHVAGSLNEPAGGVYFRAHRAGRE